MVYILLAIHARHYHSQLLKMNMYGFVARVIGGVEEVFFINILIY